MWLANFKSYKFCIKCGAKVEKLEAKPTPIKHKDYKYEDNKKNYFQSKLKRIT